MKLVIANWKLNPSTEDEAIELAKKEDLDGVILMPPLSFLAGVGDVLKKAKLGSQDVFYEDEGAYTGEVSSEQLESVGVKYVLVGHSERRAMGETETQINKKVRAALKEGLIVVLCVGEKERKDITGAKDFVKAQLESALDKVASSQLAGRDDKVAPRCARDDCDAGRVIIAYEPVWAISSHSGGASDTPEDAAEMIGSIKEFLEAKSYKLEAILYGGSVNGEDAKGFLDKEEIDGVLVGSASLKSEEFKKIVETAS